MGNVFNPGNDCYVCDRNDEFYVDKTGLLSFLNSRLRTAGRCIALSHSRRFGKSQAADMIGAYYSRGCDSSKIFEGTKIAQNPDFLKHLNKYNVIHLDISSIWDFHKNDIVEEIIKQIVKDIKDTYSSELELDYQDDINNLLFNIYTKTNIPFVIIIDEWDCVIRNSQDKALVHRYLQFLHALFKSKASKSFLALGYITGILPIKKIEDESALNNFREYTMLRSYPITEYYGFTEDEVKDLCEKHDMDFDSMRIWYNGYLIDGMHMFNPNSIVEAIQNRSFSSYWKNTSAFDTVNNFITLNFEGLKDDVIRMLAGENVLVETSEFHNDFSVISSKDDALTALMHLGYLAYQADTKMAYIPNYEVATSFQSAIKIGCWKDIAKSISACNELLEQTIEGNAARVAELLELAHETYSSSLSFNDENSLSCALTLAYFTAPAYYSVIREFPAGKGGADFAFLPRKNAGSRPAMIVELTYDKSAESAIKKIKEKSYAGALKGYSGKILLVGINYDSTGADKKKHTCIIEEYRAQ